MESASASGSGETLLLKLLGCGDNPAIWKGESVGYSAVGFPIRDGQLYTSNIMTQPETSPSGKSLPIRKRRRKPWRIRIIALALGFAMSLGLLEVALRLAGVGFPNFFEPDVFCGSRLRKSTTGVWTSEGHGHISINSLGFRGPEFSLDKPKDVFRICVLGDSFIEALQVDEPDTFCTQLQTLLNSPEADTQNSARKFPYEVINCGVSGYGTAQQLLLLQNYVLPLKPDIVLLAVFPENDIRNNSRVLDTAETRPYFTIASDGSLIADMSFRTSQQWLVGNSSYERIKASIINRSRILQLAQQMRKPTPEPTAAKPDVKSQLMASVKDNWYIYRDPGTGPSSEASAWQVTDRLLGLMSEECLRSEVPFGVFTVPTPVQVWPDQSQRDAIAAESHIDDWFYSQSRLQLVCKEFNVPLLTLASEMQKLAEQGSEFLVGFDNATPGIGHWNHKGNSAAAAMVFEWLKSPDGLPLPHKK